MALPARAAAATLCAVLAVTAAACKGRTTVGPGTTVTVTPSAPAATSPSVTSSPAPASSTASLSIPAPVALGAPQPLGRLAGTCDTRLADPLVSKAVDGFTFEGETQFVVGLPDRSTGRVGYLDCRYGVDSDAPKLEIYVGLYRTAALAKARVAPTVRDFGEHDATAAATTVSGFPATLLSGGTDTGYGPSIVLAYGQRTVAVTLGDDVLPESAVTPALKSLTALAAKRTSS